MRAVMLLGGVLALALPGHATEPPSGEPSAVRLIRLVGHPGTRGKRAAAAELTLDVGRSRIPFQAERVDVLRGNVLGGDVLAEIAPRRPSLRLRGARAVLAKLEAATARDEVDIIGYHRPGSQDLLVSDVHVSPGGGGTP
jgi:hypothetical protein